MTLDELVAAAAVLFKEADKDKKGKLDEKALAAGINLLSPRPGFGPGGPGGGFGMGNGLARPVLQALDTDKDGKVSKEELVAATKRFFKDCDKDNKSKLDAKALAEGLNRLFPPPPLGFGPPGGGPGGPGGGRGGPGGLGGRPGGPGGFGPGAALASAIVKRADTDKDGKVTLDELVAAAEAFFKEVDKDKKGKLDEQAVAAGINRLFPQPDFGPGGPGGPGGGFRPGGPGGPGGGFGPPPGARPGERKEESKKEERKP